MKKELPKKFVKSLKQVKQNAEKKFTQFAKKKKGKNIEEDLNDLFSKSFGSLGFGNRKEIEKSLDTIFKHEKKEPKKGSSQNK